MYSIIADEARDCSNKEEMSIALRYVDSNLDIREDDFLSFIVCENDLTGKNLVPILIKKIDFICLEIENCWDQAYDDAGNVVGPKSGLTAEITCLNSTALYMHCFSHLDVANIFKIASVYNLMHRIREITEFFNYSQIR